MSLQTPDFEPIEQPRGAEQDAPIVNAGNSEGPETRLPDQWMIYAKFGWLYVLRPLWLVCIKWPLLLTRALLMSREDKMLLELKTMRKMMAEEKRRKGNECGKQ